MEKVLWESIEDVFDDEKMDMEMDDLLEDDDEDDYENYFSDPLLSVSKLDTETRVVAHVEWLFGEGEHSKSKIVCEKGLRFYPESVTLLSYLCLIKGVLHENEEAADLYKKLKAIPFKQHELKSHMNMASYLILNADRNYHKIKVMMRNLKKWYPNEPEVYSLESQFYKQQKKMKKSEKALRTAVKECANADSCALLLQKRLLSQGKYKEVIKLSRYISQCQVGIRFPDQLIFLQSEYFKFASKYCLLIDKMELEEVTPIAVKSMIDDFKFWKKEANEYLDSIEIEILDKKVDGYLAGLTHQLLKGWSSS